jgi:hypothetical protein
MSKQCRSVEARCRSGGLPGSYLALGDVEAVEETTLERVEGGVEALSKQANFDTRARSCRRGISRRGPESKSRSPPLGGLDLLDLGGNRTGPGRIVAQRGAPAAVQFTRHERHYDRDRPDTI